MGPARITFMNFSFGDGQSAPTTQVPQDSGYATFSFSHVFYGSTFGAHIERQRGILDIL